VVLIPKELNTAAQGKALATLGLRGARKRGDPERVGQSCSPHEVVQPLQGWNSWRPPLTQGSREAATLSYGVEPLRGWTCPALSRCGRTDLRGLVIPIDPCLWPGKAVSQGQRYAPG